MVEAGLVEFGEGIFGRIAPGPGDQVLWIHGYTMDSSLWLELWGYLPRWHHIGIDLPFHGASPEMETPYTMPAFAQLIGNYALGQGVKHIAGLSLGAVLALQIATEFPDSFLSVTLGSAGISHGPNDPLARPHFMRLSRLYRQWGAGPWMTKLWMKWPPDIFKGASAHPELWQRLEHVINQYTWAEFRDPFMSQLTAYRQIDNLDKIGRIQSPTLLVVGEEEMPAFKEAAAILKETIPHCEYVYLPQAGHLCLLEQPCASANAIGKFLQKWESVHP